MQRTLAITSQSGGQMNPIPEDNWQKIKVERSKGKYQMIRVHERRTHLRHYEGEVREIIITNHGRIKPTFLITNDFDSSLRTLIKKYSRRWLVEQEIAEQIAHFNLNNPSSSIVVKVDFDLTLSLLAHNLYVYMAKHLTGFEKCTAQTLHRKFLDNGASVSVQGDTVTVQLKKKTHMPILFQLPWINDVIHISWLGLKVKFLTGASS